MIQIKMVFETKKIILIGMLILIIIFIFGCTESAIPFGAKNCDENINCFLEATASCNHVVGKIYNS